MKSALIKCAGTALLFLALLGEPAASEIHAQVVDLRRAQAGEGLAPDLEAARRRLLAEDDLPRHGIGGTGSTVS